MRPFAHFLASALVLAIGWTFVTTTQAQESKRPEMEFDARGPVHEAFARPWQANPTPNEPVPKRPPDPVPEEPPEEKPQGRNIQWIPGYWQWDPDRMDFLWVSGFWRDVPEGRRWIMGYWSETDDGWRWVNGHWAAQEERDYQYVPEPPSNPDQGPTTGPPDSDSFYIPGSYFYSDDGYYYRDAYWSGCRQGYVWVPAQYVWSPYGYIYCSGYWDYDLAYRGMLFAPCYFDQPVWSYYPGWNYRPSLVVSLVNLVRNLFVFRPFGQYYFGDFYARNYLNRGFYPWFWSSRNNFDPIFAYSQWNHRNNPQWAAQLRNDYIARVNGTQPLPPRTLSAQQQLLARVNGNVPGAKAGVNGNSRADVAHHQMLQTLADARQSGKKLDTVPAQQRAALQQTAQAMLKQSQQLSKEAPRVAVTSRNSASGRANVPGAAAGGSARGNNRVDVNPGGVRNGNRADIDAGAANRPKDNPNRGQGAGAPAGNRSGSVAPGSNRPSNITPPGSAASRGVLPGGGAGSSPPAAPRATPPNGGNRPSVNPPSGGANPPSITPPSGGGSRPVITPPSGGNRPNISPPSGGGSRPMITPPSGGNRPSISPPSGGGSRPSFSPPSGGGSRPMITPPSGGNRPNVSPPSGGGGSRPSISPGSGGGSRPSFNPGGAGSRPSGGSGGKGKR